jgi:hypothetical protein
MISRLKATIKTLVDIDFLYLVLLFGLIQLGVNLWVTNFHQDSIWDQDSDQLQAELEANLMGKSVEDVVLFLEQHGVKEIEVSDERDYVRSIQRVFDKDWPLSFFCRIEYVPRFYFENGKLVKVKVDVWEACL